jgi:ABC-type Fe3+-hydroxamate transport system substrate-binding protein
MYKKNYFSKKQFNKRAIRFSSVLLMLLATTLNVVFAKDVAIDGAKQKYRIVTLAPHITELFFEVGAGGYIVGTVDYANYPAAAKKIERVGAYNSISIERIIALQPDFIVAIPGSAMGPQIEKLQKLGLDVRFSDPENAQDVAEQLVRIGGWVQKTALAQARADQFLADWQALKTKYQAKDTQAKPTVFFQAWLKPLMTLNKDNLISEVIELCGGLNLYADLPMPVPHVSIESVITRAPDVIVYSGPQPSIEAQKYWQLWPSIPAVTNNRIYWVHADDLARPVPNILIGAKAMCAHIHGETQ